MFRKDSVETNLRRQYDRLLTEMERYDPISEEFDKLSKHVKTFGDALGDYREGKISVNSLLTVAGHITGIGMILAYENKGEIITSKALGFIPKLRAKDSN